MKQILLLCLKYKYTVLKSHDIKSEQFMIYLIEKFGCLNSYIYKMGNFRSCMPTFVRISIETIDEKAVER